MRGGIAAGPAAMGGAWWGEAAAGAAGEAARPLLQRAREVGGWALPQAAAWGRRAAGLGVLVALGLCLLGALLFGYRMGAKRMQRYAKTSAERRRLRRRLEAKYTLLESIPTGWVNIIIKELWMLWFEPWASKESRRIFDNLLKLAVHAEGAPSYLKDVEVRNFTWGIEPPILRHASIKYSPSSKELQLAFDFDLVSKSMYSLLHLFVKPLRKMERIVVPAEVNYIAFEAEFVACIKFTNLLPGISTVNVGFSDRPTIDLRLLPFSIALTDLPGLSDWLNSTLENTVEQHMVSPKAVPIEMGGWINGMRMPGVGGRISVNVLEAVGLKVGVPKIFCEVTLNQTTRRTFVCKSSSPRWDLDLGFDLPVPTSEEAQKVLEFQGELKLRCFNAVDGEEAASLGEVTLKVVARAEGGEGGSRDGVAQKPALNRRASSYHGLGKDTETVVLHWDMKSHTVLIPFGANNAGAVRLELRAVRGTDTKVVYADKCELCTKRMQLMAREASKQNGHGTGRPPTHAREGSRELPSFSSLLSKVPALVGRKRANGENGHSRMATDGRMRKSRKSLSLSGDLDAEAGTAQEKMCYDLLGKIVKLERALTIERNVHQNEVQALEDQLKKAQKILDASRRRRTNESLRSLLEGARFTVHRKTKSKSRHVWYDRATDGFKFAVDRQRKSKDSHTDAFPLKKVKFILKNPINPDNTSMSDAALLQRKDLSYTKILERGSCITWILSDMEPVYLEIPLGGNGRSRDEWLHAFNTILSNTKHSLLPSRPADGAEALDRMAVQASWRPAGSDT